MLVVEKPRSQSPANMLTKIMIRCNIFVFFALKFFFFVQLFVQNSSLRNIITPSLQGVIRRLCGIQIEDNDNFGVNYVIVMQHDKLKLSYLTNHWNRLIYF